MRLTPSSGFFERVQLDFNTGCWNWQGGHQGDGYGVVKFRGECQLTHRVSAHLFSGFDIASPVQVLHKCDNPSCVNPKHFFYGSHADNMHDMSVKKRLPNSRKTHCPQGHPYDGENLYVSTNGQRVCRICTRAAWHKWYDATKDKII